VLRKHTGEGDVAAKFLTNLAATCSDHEFIARFVCIGFSRRSWRGFGGRDRRNGSPKPLD
jgi:hypothetical protein